ncbi:unnamed protein product [Peniophora sp. CBMAI 1063]|nr:unnamed protein product [Peniophora sp. CBMAI 1063]
MSAELDSIWDLPAESASSLRPELERAISVESDAPATRPAKRPLFLPGDSDEEDAARSPRRSTPPRASAAPDDIDAMFEGLDELDDRPALDLDRVRREADARNAAAARAKYAVSSSQPQLPTKKGKERMTTGREEEEEKDENGKKKKQKKVRAKLDENRLLGEFGFPQLIKDTKGFVPRGKGQEAKDLDRVMELYRMWAHRMWPKDKFKDTVQRVEKLCHSKRMHNALGQFHDEAKGLVNGRQPEVDVDLTSDAEREDRSPHSSRSSSPAPASTSNAPRVIELDDDDIFGDSIPTRSFSRAPTQDPPSSNPPSSPASGPENYDDMDLDAILAADEAAKKDAEFIEARAPKPPPPPADDFDDDAMWDALDEAQSAVPKAAQQPQKTPAHNDFDDDDEDMWDAVREAEAGPAKASTKPASVDKRRRAEEEEMESMYA